MPLERSTRRSKPAQYETKTTYGKNQFLAKQTISLEGKNNGSSASFSVMVLMRRQGDFRLRKKGRRLNSNKEIMVKKKTKQIDSSLLY